MLDNLILSKVKGKYRTNGDLSKMCWFGVGGTADGFFIPADLEDLRHLLLYKPKDIPIFVLGMGSNVLIRDGGVEGIVIRLGREFNYINHNNNGLISAGAAVLDINLSKYCLDHSITGLEFLSGIPGSIGGALKMNAGAYGNEISKILVEATAISTAGEIRKISNLEMAYGYRCNGIGDQWIFTEATFKAETGHPEQIQKKMDEIRLNRQSTQPIKSRTGGSTFKNPPGDSAWKLIDKSGCRGLTIGGAQVSIQHCNFLINNGNATASDIENLIEEIQTKVLYKTGVYLEPEIKIIGRKL